MTTIGIGMASMGKVREWHSPHNADCPHNMSPAADCACKLQIKRNGKKKHKPRIIFRVTDNTVDRGVKPELVAELHDDGKLIIRESKCRKGYETTLGKTYCRLMRNFALQAAATRSRERQASRTSAKITKRLASRLARRSK